MLQAVSGPLEPVTGPLEPRLLRRLLELGTSTLFEAGGATGAIDACIRPAWKGAALCGVAYPIACHIGDNLPVHRALEHCHGGEVLVVDGRGFVGGYWGEVLTVAAQVRGVMGLIIDGGVRDVDALERLAFPAFSRGIAMQRTVKHERGTIGEPILLGGVLVNLGDVVVADSDGVLVISRVELRDVLDKAEARAAKEAEVIRLLKAGELTLDLLGLRSSLGGAGR